MNNGKICVSVLAETTDEMIALLRRAEDSADVVEIRLDALDLVEINALFEQLSSDKQILLTMRPQEQGGHSDLSFAARTEFWRDLALNRYTDLGSIWIDQEYDLVQADDFTLRASGSFVVRSQHFLNGEIPALAEAYEAVMLDSDVGKIAVTTEDIADAIDIWKLLLKANAEGKRMIPIAMGEAGKWTRILGPAHGAFMTYAALESGGETAPGQLAVDDLAEVFRVRELDRETLVYGIIAGNTSYSVSPWMHNAAFKAAGLNSVFVPLQTANLDQFMKRMVLPAAREIELNFNGFAVTNPHKQAIIGYLDEIDETAARIGAVNTVKIDDGGLHGYNTDAFGFISTLKKQFGDLSGARVAVFGAGGAARACVYALHKEGADVTVFARNEKAGSVLADEFEVRYEPPSEGRRMEFDIAVNSTPLGTAGASLNETVLSADQMNDLTLVYDLVYNPSETRLVHEAKAAGVRAIGGLEMVIAQGARQFEIWTGLDAPVNEMRAAIEKHL